MNPFFILRLDPHCTNEQVEQRYHELVRRFPPDRAPELFPVIRQAYEALRDARARIRTRLFYFDTTHRALLEGQYPIDQQARPRVAAPELAALLLASLTAPPEDP